MIDRGHCKLNFDSEGELKMFWERNSDDEEVASGSQLAKLSLAAAQDDSLNSKHSLRLSSGKVLAHRSQPTLWRQRSPKPNVSRKAISDCSTSTGTTQDPRTGRQVVTRAHGGSGLIGVSQLQRRALMAVEMANKKVETKARNKYMRILDQSTNKTGQKHYKVCGHVFLARK